MQNKNLLLRILIPLLLVGVAILVAYAVFKNSAQSRPPVAPAQAAPTVPATQPGTAPAGDAATPAPAPSAPALPAITGLHAQVFEADTPLTPLGDLDPDGHTLTKLEFSPVGAGVASLRLAHHFDTIERKPDEHTEVQSRYTKQVGANHYTLTAFAALAISIDDQIVQLSQVFPDPGAGQRIHRLWREVAPGHFESVILDGADQPVARITRRFELTADSYDITLHQSIENLSAAPISVRWYQLGPVELPRDAVSYGGDKRRLRFGYLPSATINPSRQYIAADDFLWARLPPMFSPKNSLLGPHDKATGLYPREHAVWPNDRSTSEGYELSWIGMTSRYFGVAVHPLIDPANPAADKVLHSAAAVDRILLDPSERDPNVMVAAARLTSPVSTLDAGGTLDMSVGIYAGPLSHPVIRKEDSQSARLVASGIDGIVVYNFGGPCSFCTFTWITGSLFWLLHILHDYILHDWALSIIFLVVCVRSALHPITKWSQIRVQRFGKQMQGMAPKQKQIQEKYGNDKKKLQEEMGRLWKEEGVNPAGMLGCLPMFLQTPVWIALYAMLFFAFELRQQPAFFGVFQAISGGKWHFLGDLAEPDRCVVFGQNFTIPFLTLMGPIHSLNILPFILAVVFFVHQKYLTPPPTAAMTPEQQQQQKIMKWMTVIMFPVMMYNAPSGLAMYFIANSTIAIFESRYIRAHITKNDLLNPKAGKPATGFMKYLSDVADQQRQTLQNRFGQQKPTRPGDRGGKPDPRRGGDEPPRRFKGR